MAQTDELIGRSKAALDTPSLLIDMVIMEANIARIAGTCRDCGVHWRPHCKGHKTPEIARMELAAGAVGITCAKLGEAEVMAGAGIRDILIANQIVDDTKVRRLMDLLEKAEPIVAIDNVRSIGELGGAAAARGKRLGIVIEVDIGMRRAGVAPGAPVVALAREIAGHNSLCFMGVMGWESHTVTMDRGEAKARAVDEALELLTTSADACRDAGLAVEIVSCGGTGTFPYCARKKGITEVQVGGGIFSDRHYRVDYHTDFPYALTILATVTSRPTPSRIVLDSGRKAMSGETAMPLPLGLPPVATLRLSAEHSIIELEAPSEVPEIGDRVEFVVGYSDTTVHLHEELIAMRNGCIEARWQIAARGKIK